jgi:hypothetical protein
LARERDQSGVRLKAAFNQSGRPLWVGGSTGGSILCGVSDIVSTRVRKESSERISLKEAKVIGKEKAASSRKRKFNRRGDFSKRDT